MTDTMSAGKFLAWAAEVGIGFDPRYPGTNCLSILSARDSLRFWMAPDHPYSIPHFIGAILDGLDNWETAYLWPRIGRWTTAGDMQLPNEVVRDVIWRGAGLPAEWDGAVRVGRDERPAIVAALFASLALGGDGCSDLFFVPDHGRQIVMVGHHDAVDVECKDETRVLELVRHLAEAGYTLPTEPPDATFKWQPWMRPDSD